MAFVGTVPRRCVNLPPGTLASILAALSTGRLQEGPALEQFTGHFEAYLGVPHVFGVAQGRSAFQLALEALDLRAGGEIVFPVFTFPVMPLVAKRLGFTPVFCDVDAESFNAQARHIEASLTDRTVAVLATHLFGQPCDIVNIAALTRQRGIRLLEDCAHACGVRVDGKQAGTFGDVGVYSFAEGKNMPCLGGGAIAVQDRGVAERARAILADAPAQANAEILKKAVSTWAKWFLTRPLVFGLTAYPALRLKLAAGKPLMDSAVGNTLLDTYAKSNPRVTKMANLQGTIGLRQLRHIDAFNEGARRNAAILTRALGDVPGIRIPPPGSNHIYVYYPIAVEPDKRNALRCFLLRHGIDAKITDMSDCSELEVFRGERIGDRANGPPREASLLEICVYPVISEKQIRRVAEAVRAWSTAPQ